MKNVPFMHSFGDPKLDYHNMSISKATKNHESLDPHFSSGVFRRAFYVTVKQKGFPLKELPESIYTTLTEITDIMVVRSLIALVAF